MSRPRLLDLFCGAGGAARGYQLAGFHVTGIDIKPQPRYAGDIFIQGDALNPPVDLREFDAIHASPPCQAYSVAAHPQRLAGKVYADLLAPTRTMLDAAGVPWVIENVPGAPMRVDFVLCGCMVGLKHLRRRRWFETSWHGFAMSPTCFHPDPIVSVVGHGTPSGMRGKFYGRDPLMADRVAAMGIDWMNRDELSQAIPPAFTQYIGEQLLEHISLPTTLGATDE